MNEDGVLHNLCTIFCRTAGNSRVPPELRARRTPRVRTRALRSLQKPSRIESVAGTKFDDEQSELEGLLLERTQLLLPVLIFLVLQAFIDVVVPPAQQAIDEAGEFVGHGGDRLGGAEFPAEAPILGAEVALTPKEGGGTDP